MTYSVTKSGSSFVFSGGRGSILHDPRQWLPVPCCPMPASVASSLPHSSRPQTVAPRPLRRLPPPAFVASSPSYVVPVVPFVLEPGWLGYAWIFLRVMCFFVNFLTLTELTRFFCVFSESEIEPSCLTNFFCFHGFHLFFFW